MAVMRTKFAVLLMVVAVSSLSAAQQYTVTDMGGAGYQFAAPQALSNNGLVGGVLVLLDGAGHAFFWSSSTGMLDLGLLHPNDPYSGSYGVNDAGMVVGYSGTYGFVWTQSGGMQDIGNLGGTPTVAEGINNFGQIVGTSVLADGTQHAFLYTTSGGMKDLGSLGGDLSVAMAINDSGQVVGFSLLADNITTHAFLWTQTGGIQDLGTIVGSSSSYALAINSSEEVVGYTTTSSGSEAAFYWNPIQGMRTLENPASFQTSAEGINANSQIVGVCTNNSVLSRGVLWARATQLKSLGRLIPPANPYPIWAKAINRAGQIVGLGNNNHALLLTPTKQPSSQRSQP
jgi:probable HAF family extracellular repeat protein